MPGTPSRRNFVAGGLAAAGGTLAAGALSMTGSSAQAFAAAPEAAPFPKTPDEALARLLAGNKRFVEGHPQSPRRDSVRRVVTADEQKPFAIILTCSDSRLAPEVIFDKGIGDLFVVRVAGNTAIDPVLIGSMEYSVLTFGSVLLMVLGHTECGAVKAAVDVVAKGETLPGELNAVTQPIEPAVQAVQSQPTDQILDAAIRENVKLTQEGLGQIPTFADAVQSGKLKIVGYEYQLKTGKVTAV
jgi:carbonic anhydrase